MGESSVFGEAIMLDYCESCIHYDLCKVLYKKEQIIPCEDYDKDFYRDY